MTPEQIPLDASAFFEVFDALDNAGFALYSLAGAIGDGPARDFALRYALKAKIALDTYRPMRGPQDRLIDILKKPT